MKIKLLNQILAAYVWSGPILVFIIGSIIFIEGGFIQNFSFDEYVILTILLLVVSVPWIIIGIGIWRQRRWGYIGGLVMNVVGVYFLFVRQFNLIGFVLLLISTILFLFLLFRPKKYSV